MKLLVVIHFIIGEPAVVQFTGALPYVDIPNEGSKYHD